MTPHQLAKNNTEHGHQQAVFAWANIAEKYGFNVARDWINDMGLEAAKTSYTNNRGVSALKWMHAIPNGGIRGDDKRSRMIRGAQLKAEGVRSGVADIFLPVPRGQWHGLYIELKRIGKNARSENQIAFQNHCHDNNYGHVFCEGWEAAINIIEEYLKHGRDSWHDEKPKQ